MADSSYNYEAARPSRSLLLRVESWLTSLFGLTHAIKRSLQAVPMTQRFLLLGVLIIGVVLLILVIKQYKKNKQLKKYFTEPVFICNIDGKCIFDHSRGAHDASKTYYFYQTPNGPRYPYAPRKYFDAGAATSFTLGFWFYLNALPEGTARWDGERYLGKWKHIMHKGTPLDKAVAKVQTPGFWFWPEQNKMWVVMSTIGSQAPEYGEGIILDNVPLNKWTNITLVVQNRTMDLYVDGGLERTLTLFRSPKTHNGNLYITNDGGFPGKLAYVQYYNKVLDPEGVRKAYNYYKKNITKHIEKLQSEQLKHPFQNDWIYDDEFAHSGEGGTTDDPDGGACAGDEPPEEDMRTDESGVRSGLTQLFSKAKGKVGDHSGLDLNGMLHKGDISFSKGDTSFSKVQHMI